MASCTALSMEITNRLPILQKRAASRTKQINNSNSTCFSHKAGISCSKPSRFSKSSHQRPIISKHKSRVAFVVTCAASSKSFIPSHGFDYYDLLGVDPTAPTAEVRAAYRLLQKQCHPDVAGDMGHNMAILLNEAYSVLSDPVGRFTYDQLRGTWLQDESFTGRPVFSSWKGHPEETRAIFVDEVSCIGCLNCVLIAKDTFAIEQKYGRARAIKQWGDDEETLEDAMAACPVSCIKWVERTQLPALEHVMMEMPRSSVAVANNGSDVKQPDVFWEAHKFLEKRSKKAKQLEEKQTTREAHQDAADAIQRYTSGFWRRGGGARGGDLVPLQFSDPAAAAAAAREARAAMAGGGLSAGRVVPEELKNLHAAAQKRHGSSEASRFQNNPDDDSEYWVPDNLISCAVRLPEKKQVFTHRKPRSSHPEASTSEAQTGQKSSSSWLDQLLSFLPVVVASVEGASIGMSTGDASAQSASEIKALLPQEVICSGLFQGLLAAAVWFALASIFTSVVRLGLAYVRTDSRS